jgi:hypothetical protein
MQLRYWPNGSRCSSFHAQQKPMRRIAVRHQRPYSARSLALRVASISGDPMKDNTLAGYELHGAGPGPYLAFDVLVEAGQEPKPNMKSRYGGI